MADQKKQIGIVFGVKGGSNVRGTSGGLIHRTLKEIATNINNLNDKKLAVTFRIDETRTTKQIQSQLNNIAKGLKITIGGDVGETTSKKAQQSLSALQKQVNNAYAKTFALGGNADNKRFANLNASQLHQYNTAVATLKQSFADVGIQIDELNGAPLPWKDLNLTDEQMQKLVADYQNFVTVEQQLATIQNKNTTAVKNENLAREKLLNNMSQYMDKYKDTLKNTPQLAAQLKQLFDDTKAGKYKNQLGQVKTEFEELQIAIRAGGGETETLLQKGARVVKEKLGFGLAASAAMFLRQQVKQVIQTVIELDKAVVDLQIATGKSRAETQAMVKEYANLARELGATTTEVAQAADTWLRQGYSVEESNKLIKQSMMLSKLGQMDAADASKALTSALKGYELEASKAAEITDMLVSVDIVAATTSGDIATAMAETATSARIAGVEMSDLIGILTSISEVTQDAPESVGTFAKTMFARMGNVKLGKLDELVDGESISDVETVLNQYNIKLRDSANTFRNFGTVLSEVAGGWENYDSVQQHAIASAFAGTRQQEKFLTLMEHFPEAMKYAEVATNSAGTAQEKYANAYLPSTEAAINSFKTTFEELSQTLADSDAIAGLIKFGETLLKVVNGLAEADLLLPAIVAGFMSFKNVGKLNNQNMPAYAQLRLVA